MFIAEALMYMQDAPVAKAQSYMRIGSTPTKESLAFGAVSKLNATPMRLCVQGANDTGFAVLAGRADDWLVMRDARRGLEYLHAHRQLA